MMDKRGLYDLLNDAAWLYFLFTLVVASFSTFIIAMFPHLSGLDDLALIIIHAFLAAAPPRIDDVLHDNLCQCQSDAHEDWPSPEPIYRFPQLVNVWTVALILLRGLIRTQTSLLISVLGEQYADHVEVNATAIGAFVLWLASRPRIASRVHRGWRWIRDFVGHYQPSALCPAVDSLKPHKVPLHAPEIVITQVACAYINGLP